MQTMAVSEKGGYQEIMYIYTYIHILKTTALSFLILRYIIYNHGVSVKSKGFKVE
jgi:hypothetical protein